MALPWLLGIGLLLPWARSQAILSVVWVTDKRLGYQAIWGGQKEPWWAMEQMNLFC